MNDLKYLTNYISVRYEVSKYCAKNILSLAGNRDICIDFIHKNIPMKKWYSENYATDIYNNIISSSELEPFTIKLAELEKSFLAASVHHQEADSMPSSVEIKAESKTEDKVNNKTPQTKAPSPQAELPLFMEALPSEVEEEIKALDANDLTPRMALDLIYAWQKKLR